MKNTRICIKCKSEKVVRISEVWFLCTEYGYSEECVESEKDLELLRQKF